jgi:hypothetical protein
MSADEPVAETNREAFRRMAREACEEQEHIPAWMRTPPTEPTAWNARESLTPTPPAEPSEREAE